MDIGLKRKFMTLWTKYFNGSELPVTFYYTDEEGQVELIKPNTVSRCLIGALQQVRKGKSMRFQYDSIGCAGGRRYLGFTQETMPNFEYFLSCGLPGKVKGERYKKNPEMVKKILDNSPMLKAPARYVVFKRWDMLETRDNPDVAVFFCQPDVLAGLFTLANFDQVEPDGVFTPFGAGCSTIIQYPYLEKDSQKPRGVIGLFDISARPHVMQDILTFAAPIKKMESMIYNIDESFLITDSWSRVKSRITKGT